MKRQGCGSAQELLDDVAFSFGILVLQQVRRFFLEGILFGVDSFWKRFYLEGILFGGDSF